MSPIANRYTIKAHSFRCLEESDEWSASDEVYWLFAYVAAGIKGTSSSHVYNDVDAGEAFGCGPTEGWIWGTDGQPHTFPNGEIGAVVTCMEHDEGNVDDVRAAFAAGVATADAILAASGVAAWVGAVVAAIGGLIGVILGFMDDDHVGDVGFTWDKTSINSIVGMKGGSFDGVQELGTPDEGRHRIRIRVTRLV